jgi:hypothetical protein
MVNLTGHDVRELAYTVAGALIGSLARRWVDPVWPGAARASAYTFMLILAAAALVGFARVGSIRGELKTILVAAGGAAGSVSIAATRAVSATPAQSVIGLVVFLAGGAAGLPLGMSLARFAANHPRKERC